MTADDVDETVAADADATAPTDVADAKDAAAGDFAAEGDTLATALPDIAWTKNYLTPDRTPAPPRTRPTTALSDWQRWRGRLPIRRRRPATR